MVGPNVVKFHLDDSEFHSF